MRRLACGLLVAVGVVTFVSCSSDTPQGAAGTSGTGGAAASAGSSGRAEPAAGNSESGSGAGEVEISDAGAAGECSAALCSEGFRKLTESGRRCPICAGICAAGNTCTAGGCPDGLDFIDSPQAGQCCPTCVVGSAGLGGAGAAGEGGGGGTDICDRALTSYQAYLALLLDDGGLSCSSDIECVLMNPMFACGVNCPIVVNEASAAEVKFQLGMAALDLCSHCPLPSPSACPPLKAAVCVNHLCTNAAR